MTADLPYKTLFVGELVQKTGFSIGGNQPHGRVDAPLCRDGDNRPTLRGSGLAGALLATARKLYNDLPADISAGTPKQQDPRYHEGDDGPRLPESIWRVFNSHPLGSDGQFSKPDSEYRAGVGILQRTGAAAEGVKFETETLPAGTRWWFCLEVDDYREDRNKAGVGATIAGHALKEWRQGRCWLGRDVARGLGWMELKELKIYRLTSAHVGRWPNAQKKPWEVIEELPADLKLDENGLKELLEKKPPDRAQHGLSGRGTISVGRDAFDKESYGLDTLSVGATEAMRPHQVWSGHYVKAEGMKKEDAETEFDPDHILAWTRPAGDSATPVEFQPYIPGSSLRGPWRHALSWWLRSRKGKTIWDPNSREKITQDEISELFGTTENSAALLISDAHLCGDDYQVALLDLHAEDEFTAGAYEGAKFNQLCLLKGRFTFEFSVEAGCVEKLERFKKLLTILKQLGVQNFLPLGAGKWRGHGWIKWEIEWDGESEPCPDAQETITAEEATP